MISAYIIALCVATMVATAFMKETRGHDLHRVGHN
jgi:MHS family alpha-ketoglutarate permease-like MFS transporter